ncbi:DUF2877 domain-containing protein [Embleya scabrispora]|uniref:DUF2877 domain-containing protein n=1 Tax=Embleya scabrispora TaxID=159449 RepID=UPI00037C4F77|nr:DUF2877 domain-containing protein [Embleya scabrispora]MYS83975.1 DUF2877 domain-containing protein [Streptomyces sp. SID5474]
MVDPGEHADPVSTTPVPGSASVRVRAALEGPTRPARVLGVFPAAIYLADPERNVLALCTHDAVRLPNAVVLAARTAASPFPALAARADARIGDGRVSLGALDVTVVRWWTPPRPPAPGDAETVRTGRAALRTALGPVRTGLSGRARADLADLGRYAATDSERAGAAALRLIGLGPGLTPSGDDALCGFLLAQRLLDPEPTGGRRADTLGARVAAHAPGRTTDLSAALLGHAARGDGCAQLVDLIGAVGRSTDVLPRLHRLLTVGHTSGADLAHGVLAGAEAADAGAVPAVAAAPYGRGDGTELPYPEGRSAREQRA